MTEKITDYFTNGILAQAFQAERNILIWQYIGDESTFLKTQNEYVQRLYSFIQVSAQTNFVLSLGKLFDRPKNKHPTRCILSFLQLLNTNGLNLGIIEEDTNTKRLLLEYGCPETLIVAVDSKEGNLFPILFAMYYLEKYKDISLQNEIKILKAMRDKAEAHNEAIEPLSLEFTTTTKLLNFALEIISIFGIAYRSEGWKTSGMSFITMSAERAASFIRVCINELKASKIEQ